MCNSQPVRVCDGAGIPAYGGYVAKITNDAREEEMEGNMGQVGDHTIFRDFSGKGLEFFWEEIRKQQIQDIFGLSILSSPDIIS